MEDGVCEMKVKFSEELQGLSKNANCALLSREKYDTLVQKVKNVERLGKKKPSDFWLMRHYGVLTVDGGIDKLIHPVSLVEGVVKYYVSEDKLFDILYRTHISIGHGGRDRMLHELNQRYKNITQSQIMCFLRCCQVCAQKKSGAKKNSLLKPVILNSRCQVDLVDLESRPDNEFKFVFVYQDCLTKFVILRPLTSRSVEEVADHLLDVFLLLGPPFVLQSQYGREFCAAVISIVKKKWPELRIVHGELSEGADGDNDQKNDVEIILAKWMENNATTRWSDGLRFVQYEKNRAFDPDLQRSPHEAMFGDRAKLAFPQAVLQTALTEEELIEAMDAS